MHQIPLIERCDPPKPVSGCWGWEASHQGLEIRFFGRPTAFPSKEEELPRLRCTVEQVHSATLVEAQPGRLGPADGIVLREPGCAAGVVTADCLPIVLDGGRGCAAVIHAGWRGLARGIATRAVEVLGGGAAAWIGPGIGPCCYEVGPEVADEIASRIPEQAHPAVFEPGRGDRIYLDLGLAAAIELAGCGVRRIELWRVCTRCHPAWLSSFRRDGLGCGRNETWAWWRPSTGPRKPRGNRSLARS